MDGSIGIFRKKKYFEFFRGYPTQESTFWFVKEWDDLILPVTENWLASGRPVDWGIEPIFWKIQELDSWRDDGDYDRFCKTRENKKNDRTRAHKNEMRALAADCRREFASATNEINTSIMEKVDKRRNYDGYRR